MISHRRKRRGVVLRSPEDWEEAALDAIAEKGVSGVSVPELAALLGVTKGSFYWHFASLDELLVRAVQRWEKADEATLEQISQIEHPNARIRALFTEAISGKRAPALYIALSINPSRRFVETLQRVSRRRLLALTKLCEDIGMRKREAGHQALLAYAAYVGWLNLQSTGATGLPASTDVSDYVNHALRVLFSKTISR